MLLYGIPAITLTNTELHSFSNAYNNVYFKIFHSFDKNTVLHCQWYCGFWPFELLYDYHRYNFLNKLVIAKFVDSKLELDNPDYLEFINIRHKYNILPNDSIATIRYRFWRHFEIILPLFDILSISILQIIISDY